MSIKKINEIPWEKTDYGRRKSIVSLDMGLPVIIRYVVIEGEVKPHSHENGEIIIILKGQGIIKFENWESKVGEGDIVVIPPNVKQGIIKSSEENIEAIAILPGKG
ncbi:MAG: cupin domain-containing protein [Candidatus Methanomethylicia archaeon]|nr:cupin domain-containing protein [Candidatus Methanomethylicia archaeon]